MRGKQGPACASGWIANRLTRFRAHHLHHRLDEWTRRKVLSRARFGILRILFEQTFVNLALGIDIQANPGFAVDQGNETFELGRVLDFVLCLAEDGGDQSGTGTEFLQDMEVMRFKFFPIS